MTTLLYLFASVFPPAFSAGAIAGGSSSQASIDNRRTLQVEGTDAPEAIIVEVIGEPASITVEYRRTDGAGTPRKESFRLDAFDRLAVNARGGADFVNIVDAAGLLDAQKKTLRLDGGEGDNVVVLSHLPFRPEVARRVMQLQLLAAQIEGVARRAGGATSQALTGDALRFVESGRVGPADASKSLAATAERQLFTPARGLVERSGPQLTGVGNALVARSDEFAKQHGELVAALTKKYEPAGGVSTPDDDREPPDAPQDRPDAERPGQSREEREAADAFARAEQLSQVAVRLGADAKAQVERMAKQMEGEAAVVEQRATDFEKSAEQLSATADLLAARGEKELTAAAERVPAALAELKSLERSFSDAAAALQEELSVATSMTPAARQQAKAAKVAAPPSCSTPIAASHTYTGGSGTDFFIPFWSPFQSWSINGGGGADILFGGFVNDDIRGGPGADFIFGMRGDDQIRGEDGTDFLFGEFIVDLPLLTGNDCVWGGDGFDLVVGDNLIGSSWGTPGGDDKLWGDAGIDLVVGDDVLSDIFSQTLAGGKDTLEGNDETDVLFGCGGDDQIKGNDGMDFAEGNGGDDTIDGGGGENFSFCSTTVEAGNLLLGGRDDDDVTGGTGIDLVFGN